MRVGIARREPRLRQPSYHSDSIPSGQRRGRESHTYRPRSVSSLLILFNAMAMDVCVAGRFEEEGGL